MLCLKHYDQHAHDPDTDEVDCPWCRIAELEEDREYHVNLCVRREEIIAELERELAEAKKDSDLLVEAEYRIIELERERDGVLRLRWNEIDDPGHLVRELAEARRDTERLAALLKPVKELRALLGPDGDYAICSATEGEPSMRLVESMIVGCVLEKIDAAIDKAGGE